MTHWDEVPPKIQYLNPKLPEIELDEGVMVYALEKFECNDVSGDWLQLYAGEIKSQKGNDVLVIVKDRVAMRYHPESQGILAGDWWCTDQRKFCYAGVKFTDWGGKYQVNQAIPFSKNNVFSRELGIVNVSKRIFGEKCQR